MYKQGIYKIVQNAQIAEGIFRMELAGDTQYITRPGQFVNLKLEGLFLRRPISVCSWEKGKITLIYKCVGTGTAQMSKMQIGQELDALTGLGNGFDLAKAQGKRTLLIGGGVGVPPMYGVARALKGDCTCVLGFQSAGDVFYVQELEALGCKVFVATNDGSMGTKGFVTDVIKALDYDYYFACGPEPMLKAVHGLGTPGQLSFEARMGCGFGACMGCSCHTLAGDKRICVDGPVMLSEEVTFGE